MVAHRASSSDFLSPITTESGLLGGAAYAAGLIPEPATLVAAASLIPLMLRRRS